MSQVLVIDDETGIRELLYDSLTRRGHQVTTVGSGVQALDLLKARRPQFILLDSTMPGLSGLETAKRIRAFDDTVPIVLLRGAGEPEVPGEELQRVGIGDTITKDADRDLFVGSIVLSMNRLQQAAQPKVQEPEMRVPGTLLIVDDDPQMLRLLMAFFNSRGLRVILANSGEEALGALAQQPTVVLMDVNMPGMDGLTTLRKIKAQHPELPVIMVSGVGEEATVHEALQGGAYDYVQKPFSLEYLETIVLTKILLGMEG